MSKKGSVEEEVDKIVSSVEAFNSSRSSLVYKVRDNDKSYVRSVIDQIYSIINSSKKSGLQKYLALHLCKDCVDKKTKEVVDYLAEKLLTKLGKLAESLGKAQHTKDRAKILDVTEYPEMSNNFTSLLLECLLEWPKMFADINEKYKKTYDGLVKKKIAFPTEKKYFKQKTTASSSHTGRATGADSKPSTSTTSKPAETKPQTSSTTTPQQGGKAPANHPLVIKTEKLIAELVEAKKALLENFSAAEDMEKEIIEYFFEPIKTCNNNLLKTAMELSAVANTDQLVDKAFAETGLATDLINAYERYEKETRDFTLLKMEVLAILDPKKAGQKKTESQKPPMDKKASESEQPKRATGSSKGRDSDVAHEERKSGERKSDASVDKEKKGHAVGKSASAKDPFAAFNAAKKEKEGAASSKDIFGSFGGGGVVVESKGKEDEFNFGEGTWGDQPEADKGKGDSAKQSKNPSVNDFGAWGNAPPKDGDEPWPDENQEGKKGGFGFDDFGDAFTEEEEKGNKKKSREEVKETFAATKPSKKKAEKVQLQAKDGKEEGMIIVDDPNSFAGFNFGGGGPSNPDNGAMQREPDRSHEHEEQEPVSQKRGRERKESENVPQDAFETGEFGGPEPQRDHGEQGAGHFEEEYADTRQQVQQQREYQAEEPHKAEEEEEEKGGEQKGFGWDDFGGKKEGGDEGFGDFGFGKGGDDFGKGGFFDGADFGFGDKGEKKEEDKGGDFFSANADFFSGFNKPEEESKPRKESEEPDLHSELKAKKGFSFQESVGGKANEQVAADTFSPAFQGSWDNKKPEEDFGNWGFNTQKVPDAREESDWGGGATKESEWGAFGFSNEEKKSQIEKKGGNVAMPAALGKDVSPENAIQVLLTSHLQKNAQLESEKAREERDKVYNDLEAVRKMYQEMRAQFEKIRTEQMQISGSYGRVREELTVLTQVNKDYSSEFKKLKSTAEEQKKIKNQLRQDAEQQLMKSQALNSEISQLKQQAESADTKERKELIQKKISDLEKQLESNTNFLQTVNQLLQASEQEDQENIQKISKLSEFAGVKTTPPRQRSPSPEEKAKGISPSKDIDEVVRVIFTFVETEYDNPTLVSAVTLLRASRQMREHDLKAFASGKMPKVSDTPMNLKVSTAPPMVLEQKSIIRSTFASPTKLERTAPIEGSGVKERFLNLDPIVSGRTEWQPTSNLVSPNAMGGVGLSLPKFTNNFVQSPTEGQQHQSPSYQFNFNPQPQPQSQPTVDNPVLRQVTELLEKSKKLRFDNSKFSLRKDSETLAPVGSTFGDRLTGLAQTNLLSPKLSVLDPNKALPYTQSYTSPTSYGFRQEHPLGFDFGVKTTTANETTKPLGSNFLNENSLNQIPGFIRSSDPNEAENSLTAALERINLKTSNIHMKSSRFIKDNQATKVKGQKAGRFVSYNSYLFDKLARDIEFNRNLRDADLFRYACLASKSALLDSPVLQIGIISNLDRGSGSYGEPRVSIILHYGNKTTSEMSNFIVNTSGLGSVSASSEVYGSQIAPRFQLKQEFTQNFRDFSFNPAAIEVSFTHNSLTNTFTVPLPFSLVKFMEFKYISFSSFKERWRALKSECVKINHRKANPKLFNDIGDLNRFFSGLIIDLRSANPRTQKAKYGGFFTLPDNYEYFVKINKGAKGCKISVATDNPNKMHAENSVQQFAFLFTLSN